jgi:phosphoribosylglycinamide formyltransferase-1
VSGPRLAVLCSGRGSNLQALLDAELGGRVVLVVSNEPEAQALERARTAGVETAVVDHRVHPDRDAFDAALAETLRAHAIDWVLLAGFMRIVGPAVLQAFPRRILNIHPALLPAFPGLHAQRQALRAGVRVAGCTVHLVDAGVDTGPILAQAALAVRDDDDEASLSRRILRLEHALYPATVRSLLRSGLAIEDGRAPRLAAPIELDGPAGRLGDLFSPR